MRRSQWPRGLRRGSAAARLLGLWVRIQPGAWMSVCCVTCCLCVGLITRPENSYRVWCVCDREATVMRGLCPTGALLLRGKKKLHGPKYTHQTLINLLRVSTCHRYYLQGVFSVLGMVRYTVVGKNGHTHAHILTL